MDRELCKGIYTSEYYQPDTCTIMGQAFDAAWAVIDGTFVYSQSETIDQARIALARAVLAAADDGNMDVKSLKTAALHRLVAESAEWREQSQADLRSH